MPLCETHAELAVAAPPLTLADAAGLLATEVTWAPAGVRRRVLQHYDRLLYDLGRHDLLLPERPLRSVRMGQMGFVHPDDIRLDADGRLWARADASAPQRPHGADLVPVRRRLDLELEIVLTGADAARLEARLARVRPPVLGVAEERIVDARGLLRAPRLAALLS